MEVDVPAAQTMYRLGKCLRRCDQHTAAGRVLPCPNDGRESETERAIFLLGIERLALSKGN